MIRHNHCTLEKLIKEDKLKADYNQAVKKKLPLDLISDYNLEEPCSILPLISNLFVQRSPICEPTPTNESKKKTQMCYISHQGQKWGYISVMYTTYRFWINAKNLACPFVIFNSIILYDKHICMVREQKYILLKEQISWEQKNSCTSVDHRTLLAFAFYSNYFDIQI